MTQIVRHRFETAWGPCALRWSSNGLTRVQLFAETQADDAEAPHAEGVLWAQALQAYFRGEDVRFDDASLDLSALGAGDVAIYAALRRVPRGETTTYGELGDAAGLPNAGRAVGVAMARNPWPIIVPCHRVLAKGGDLRGFTAPGGLSTKRRLLRLEGVDLDHGAPPLPGLFDA
jgi:methylated-DNA-[protein]-cysteine S-methyltransferase